MDVLCHDCQRRHRVAPGSDEAEEFFARHRGHRVGSARGLLTRLAERFAPSLGYADNASVKQAFGTVSAAFTVTHLNSLATSATAGWQSDAIDNTSNLFLNYAVQFTFAAVNTAPGSGKVIYVYGISLLDDGGSAYATTGATSGGAPGGSEGTLTFPDVTANPVNLGGPYAIPYVGQNTAIITPWLPLLPLFGGNELPPKFALGLINYSGMTFAASGNSLYGRGVYRTVA